LKSLYSSTLLSFLCGPKYHYFKLILCAILFGYTSRLFCQIFLTVRNVGFFKKGSPVPICTKFPLIWFIKYSRCIYLSYLQSPLTTTCIACSLCYYSKMRVLCFRNKKCFLFKHKKVLSSSSVKHWTAHN
jgi:hypothetical protein